MPKENTARKQTEGAAPLHALPQKDGKMDVAALDRLIHERMRLAIVSALAVNPSLTFKEIKQLLGMSDGNLSVHTQKLEAAGYIRSAKGFEGRIPRTDYNLTQEGRAALERYLAHMEAITSAVRKHG